MIEHLRGNLPEQAAIGVAVGLVCGLVYFGLLWRNAQLSSTGARRPPPQCRSGGSSPQHSSSTPLRISAASR
ncbi:MAG: hypothetical protein KDJ20_12305 [Hyphomicrobiales bacterium]|nr:hypothetical protein [Hyphomicrobiales bacterium]